MRVELLYFEGCPNATIAEARLRAALDTVGLGSVPVERVAVEDPEQAEALRFTGSPTVRVDGWDPFATGSETVGYACRVYPTPDRLGGSPTLEQFVAALS